MCYHDTTIIMYMYSACRIVPRVHYYTSQLFNSCLHVTLRSWEVGPGDKAEVLKRACNMLKLEEDIMHDNNTSVVHTL